ncbi:MAG: cyclic pyranopterin monophosphate synthase MoaC [Thermoplasmata archaeon]|nr:MAG: cyclic pyranopterin monophosphate synthase MoaC [Thermoplasmata archaeon]
MTRMVDISEKETSLRMAKAKGEIKLKNNTIKTLKERKTIKGDVLSTAQTAAILAVKSTPSLIPLCHPIPIDSVEISFDVGEEEIACECEVKAHYTTGVEMESLVGVSVALLTIWDMVKYLEKDENGQYPTTKINNINVISKKKE